MKHPLIFSSLFFLLSTCVFSQTRIKVGELNTTTGSYTVSKLGSLLLIEDPLTKPSASSGGKQTAKLSSSTTFKDKNEVYNAFRKVFNQSRISQLLPERILMLNYFFNRNGQIKHIQYFVRDQTQITIQELELLDKTLKANVNFNVSSSEITTDHNWPWSQVIFFKKIYN